MFKYNLVSLCLISSISLIPIVVTSCKQQITNDNQNTEKTKTNNPKKIGKSNEVTEFKFNNSDDFFPKMNIKEYYDFIEFENHNPIITNKLKLNFIKDVIRRVATSRGKISFYVEETNKQKVSFYFKWTYNSTTLYKTYVLDLQKNFE